MKDVEQITKIFLDRFETLGQNGFFAHPNELQILGNYLKKVGNDMGINDNYKLVEFFAAIHAYMKMGNEFREWAEKL